MFIRIHDREILDEGPILALEAEKDAGVCPSVILAFMSLLIKIVLLLSVKIRLFKYLDRISRQQN